MIGLKRRFHLPELKIIALTILLGTVVFSHPASVLATIPEGSNVVWASFGSGIDTPTESAFSVLANPSGSKVFAIGHSSTRFIASAYQTDSGLRSWAASPGGDNWIYSTEAVLSPDGGHLFIAGLSQGPAPTWNETLTIIALDATTGTTLWSLHHDVTYGFAEEAYLAIGPNGDDLYVAARLGNGIKILALSSISGEELWTAQWSGNAVRTEPEALEVSPNGDRVFITATNVDVTWVTPGFGFAHGNFFTAAFSTSDGEKLWEASYEGPRQAEWAEDMAVSPDGSRVFVTGESHTEGGHLRDFATVAYDAENGSQLWEATYDGPAPDNDSPAAIAVSPDGSNVFVTGASSGRPVDSNATIILGQRSWSSLMDYATIAYSASTGTERWVARYTGPPDDIDVPYSIVTSPDGSKIFVTGRSASKSPLEQEGCSGALQRPPCWWAVNNSQYWDVATIAYSVSSGTELWAARYDGPAEGYDSGHSLAVSPDGSRIFVVGGTAKIGGGSQFLVLSYGSAGCESGIDAGGLISSNVRQASESTPVTPYVHGVNCDLIAANGL